MSTPPMTHFPFLTLITINHSHASKQQPYDSKGQISAMVITPPLIGERSIVVSVSVCLCVYVCVCLFVHDHIF